MSVWDEFDDAMDPEELRKQIEEAAAGGGGEETPHGTYDVEITKMELKKSKKGDPMISMWFKIVSDDQKGRLIFYNQIIPDAYRIHLGCEFLRSLDTPCEFKFTKYGTLSDDIEKAKTWIDKAFYEYELKYAKNDKGYNTFKIMAVLAPDDVGKDEIPF